FHASTNGLLQFANPSTAYSNSCLTSGGGSSNTIFVFWDDLRTDVSGQPAGKIQYETIGQAPHRKLVVQWTNQYFYGSNLPMGTFQAVLHEGSNEVKLQYRYLREAQSTGSSATIGMRGTPGQLNQHRSNQLNAVAAEQAISYMPSADGSSYTVDTAAPYEFLDISGLTPDAPAPAARYLNTSPSWSWVKIPELNLYQIEVQTDAGETVLSETLGDVGAYIWSEGFVSGQTYRARVRGSVNNGGTWELWSGLSQPVTVDLVAPQAQMVSGVQIGEGAITWRYSATDALSG